MKSFSKFISTIFHPLIIPLLSALLIVWSNPFAFSGSESRLAMVFLYAVGLCTFLMPLVGLFVLSKLNFDSQGQLSARQEKIIPYFMIISCYSFALYYINQLPIPSIVKAMMYGALASIILSFFWSNFLDISAEAVGIGTLLGVVLGLFFFSSRSIDALFIITLIICGLVLSAQLILNKHNLKEVVVGFLIGLFCQIIAFFLFLGLGA